ncbi:MAG: N-acetylmuramoyl-L-alanine amidase [Thermohalobaculum sp.]|nr:N-acetylmuramoyl-L-alanine amidase [Thermohalobaculum sp.]
MACGAWRRAAAWLCLVALGAGAAAGPARAAGPDAPAEIALTAVEAQDRGGDAVLTLTLSDAAPFTFFLLDAPRRLVVDYASRSGAGPARAPVLPPPFGVPRHGLFRPDRARLVVPLDRPLGVLRAVPTTAPGIEITLAPVSVEAFAARAGWPAGARWADGGAAPPPAAAGETRPLVVIDPGHGGPDPGAMAEGVMEKDVVLAFARRLARRIEASGAARAVLTRDRDVFLPLGERVRIAQRARAQVFVSIHADIVLEGAAAGVSVYTLAPEASDAAAADLAERENRADVLAGAEAEGMSDDVARVLIELAQRGSMAEAERLAAATLASLRDDVELLRTRPHRRADFRVLKAPEIPSVLIELGFLTSPADRARIVTPAWQEVAAEGVAQGILHWAREAGPAWRTPHAAAPPDRAARALRTGSDTPDAARLP